jgi:hypothetical protein
MKSQLPLAMCLLLVSYLTLHHYAAVAEHRFSRGRMGPAVWVVHPDSSSGNSVISGTFDHRDSTVFI